ncbi:hypothetical protein [Streptomyces griseorubiginosus]|uniref:hypothetical protein n=1 Tax=Streptomyces griseorubiginosus TaxID=67304 RepID=UPI0036EF493E
MTLRTSRELMAWRPPTGWRELSREQRRAYLERHDIQIPLKPADWEQMDHDQRMAYFAWHARILSDTPDARAAKEREYRQRLRAWNVLMGWWILCLIAALGIVWGTDALGDARTGMRIGFTLFIGVGYTVAIFIPMQLTRPDRPRT